MTMKFMSMKTLLRYFVFSTLLSMIPAAWLMSCHSESRKPFAEADHLVCPDKTSRVEDKTSSYPEFYCVGFDGREGDYLEFDANGRIKTLAHYTHDRLEGQWTSYHPGGSLDTTGSMKSGKREGSWTQYYVNGKLRSRKTYSENTISGPVELYYQTGKLMAKGDYQSGFEEGPWKVFTPEGQLARECDMIHGKETNCKIYIADFKASTKVYDSSERGAL